jgi:hypothetical protein
VETGERLEEKGRARRREKGKEKEELEGNWKGKA